MAEREILFKICEGMTKKAPCGPRRDRRACQFEMSFHGNANADRAGFFRALAWQVPGTPMYHDNERDAA
jgi:hypothetical protein